MKVTLDQDLCGGHGVCECEAPEVFRVVDKGDGFAWAEVILENPPEEFHEKARSAMRQCPTRAISIDEG